MCDPFIMRKIMEVGITMADLDLLSIGLINDMYAESRNDDCKCAQTATC